MSEKLYGMDQFYTGDFPQILTGVYSTKDIPIRIQRVQGLHNKGKQFPEIYISGMYADTYPYMPVL